MKRTPQGRVTVTNAWSQRGWDSRDHLITDDRMVEVIGRTFASVAHARRAIGARVDRYSAYATFEYEMGGRRYRYDCSAHAGIPGRHVAAITEI